MGQWGTRSSAEINTLNEAIIEIIKSSIDWLADGSNLSKSESDAQPRQPVRLGCRKLAYLLIGSANTTALNLRFHECPYWGALPYLSVRKIDRILRILISREILLLEKSPQLKLDVLKTNHDWNGDEIPDISEAFASERTLPLDQVDKNLLAKFKRIRLALSSRPYGKKSLPYIICSIEFSSKCAYNVRRILQNCVEQFQLQTNSSDLHNISSMPYPKKVINPLIFPQCHGPHPRHLYSWGT